MTIKKTDKGWSVDVRPAGRDGRRFRKTFTNQAEARHYEKHIIAKHQDDKPWQKTVKKDKRKLSDIADEWYHYHGHTLQSGEQRLQQVKATIASLGDPLAENFDAAKFLDYRKKRLAENITENHLNHELTYLKSMFNELISVDKWASVNPFGKIKKLKFADRELTFLTTDQIKALLVEAGAARNKDLLIIITICLSIGCRWGEAQNLKRSQVHHGKIHLTKTKNGKNRSIPIDINLEKQITAREEKQGKLFGNARDAFRGALDRADIKLPKGQLTHVLRHTFASHFMMNGGNILDLNKILGHKTIQMTMIYAHLSPEHLAEAVNKNPLIHLAA